MRILVIGDVMLDWDNISHVSRISPEAPILVADVQKESFNLGGAANVAQNLKSLGCEVNLCGVVGDDYFSDVLRGEISKKGINHQLFTEFNRRTTVKQRFLSDNNIHLFRGDREDRKIICDEAQKFVLECVESEIKNGIAGIVVADYNKGFLGEYLSSKLNNIDIPIFADLKPPNMHLLCNLEVITPNKSEACEYFKINHAHMRYENLAVRDFGLFLRKQAKNVLITMGKNGAFFVDSNNNEVFIDSEVNTNGYNVVDTCGCGDVVTAVYTYASLCDYSPLQAAKMANFAAGMTVKDVGVSFISKKEFQQIGVKFGKIV